MSFTKQLLLTIFGVAVLIAVSEAATAAALTAKLAPKIASVENLTTTVQNAGLVTLGVNCSYYEKNISVCGYNMYEWIKGNLSSAQMTTAMAAASKYALTEGSSVSSQLTQLETDIYSDLTSTIWTPLQKLVPKSKTEAVYAPKALALVNKKATKKFICAIGAKIKKAFSAEWTTAKNDLGTLLPVIALCKL